MNQSKIHKQVSKYPETKLDSGSMDSDINQSNALKNRFEAFGLMKYV